RPFSIERDPPEGLAAMRALRAALRRPPERDEAAQVEARLLDALEHDVPQRQTIGEGRPGPLALRSVRHADDIVRAALRKLARRPVVDADRAELVGYFEQAPNRDSRVALADSRDALGLRRIRVDWRMSAQDEENIRRASRLVGGALAADVGARFEPAGWLADPAARGPGRAGGGAGAGSREARARRGGGGDGRGGGRAGGCSRRGGRRPGDGRAAPGGARFGPAGWLGDPAAPLPGRGPGHRIGTTRP